MSDPDDSSPAAGSAPSGKVFQRIEIVWQGDVCVAVLKDARLEDGQLIAQCKAELLQLAAGGKPVALVIDFQLVEHASPIALGSLMLLQKSVQTAGGKMKICNLSPRIAEVLKVARLDRILSVHGDVDAAVRSLQAAP